MKPSCVIALHGLGADGEDLMPLQAMMGMEDVPWLFPNAPELSVTANMGMRMPAWFDILGFEPTDPVDADGIRDSACSVQALIDTQVAAGLDPAKMVLLGFSQGGVIALHAALSAKVNVGAVVGLSTWLPAYEQLAPLPAKHASLPVWLGHGTYDNVVPMAAHTRAKDRLSVLGVKCVEAKTYAMAHSIVPDELVDVGAWLARL